MRLILEPSLSEKKFKFHLFLNAPIEKYIAKGDRKMAKSNTSDKQIPTNVVPFKAEKCVAEGCKKNPEKAQFCGEHFTWFKEGLITAEGQKAKDFDKKYNMWMQRSKKAA